MTGSRSLPIRRGLMWLAAAVAWSCSSATDVVENAGEPIAAVVVTPSTSTVAIGAQLPLQAIVQDASGKVVTGASILWSVQDSKVVSISSSGVVTGLAVGTTQVAASANGKSGIAAITVQKMPVASVVVRPNHVDTVQGARTPLAGIAYDAAQNPLSDRAIIWSSSNDLVAMVDTTGTVTAVAPGTATIMATIEGKSGVATVTITPAPAAAVATVDIVPKLLQMSVSQSTQMTAVPRDANGAALTGRTVTWSNSNTSVATISAQGVLTAVAAGATTITATSEGKSGTSAVTISRFAVGSVSVQPTVNSIVQNASLQLTTIVRDEAGSITIDRVVTWASSDQAVATVSSTGFVSGKAPGMATITATSEGQSGTATVTVTRIPVASVLVQPGTATVVIGQTATLTAVPKDAGGNSLTGRVVSWSSSSSAVATVSSTGVVTGVGPGTATITATSEGQSGAATVTVTALAVGSVAVTPSAPSLPVGQTMALAATVKDVNGAVVTDRVVTWSTNNAAVATVSSAGLVTAVGAGTATITATSETKSGSSTVTVTIVPVGSVTVLPATASVATTQTTTLTATVKDANGVVVTDRAVAWTSSNNLVASVSSSGVVTGVAPGTATITATSETKSGTSVVTVTLLPVATVVVSPSTASVFVGSTTTLTATTRDLSGTVLTGRVVTWVSSNNSIATVSSSGVVTGVALGSATITATSEGKSGSSTVTVVNRPVASVTVQPGTSAIGVGQTAPLTAVVRDASGTIVTDRAVNWTSSGTAVATVSATGVVTGVAPGTATITATSEGQSGTATVTVSQIPVGTVTVAPATVGLNPGQTSQLTATVKDANGVVVTNRVVTWSTNNAAVATVSSTGLVTAAGAGTATITATSETKSGSSTVTVTIVPVGSVTVLPATASVATTQTTTLTATVKDANGVVVTDRAVAWTSSNNLVASVSSSGVVTGVVPGTATITATSETKSGTSVVTVTLLPVATVVVSPSTASVFVGSTTTLTATTRDLIGTVLTGRVVTWASSNSSIATVSSSGVVTGVAPGSATITATSEGKNGTSVVTVSLAPVATVVVSPPTVSVVVGSTASLSAVTRDGSNNILTGRVVTWTSSNNAVATVSSTGVVTGVAAGSATITATSEGKSGTSVVTVSLAPVATVTVTPLTATVVENGTVQLTATLKDAAGHVLTGRTVVWSSSNTMTATVGSTGIVTGKKQGTATITATSEGISGGSTITVTK